MRKELSLNKLAVIGILGAMSVVLGMTPLGFIPLGIVNVTIMHIPVIIAAILEGPVVGAAVGLIFGVTSLVRAITSPTLLSPLFYNPLVSVLPRILIGVITAYTYRALKNRKSKVVRYAIPAGIGSLVNTGLVLFAMYIFYGRELADMLKGVISSSSSVVKWIFALGLTNGIPEMIAAMVIVTIIVSRVKDSRKS